MLATISAHRLTAAVSTLILIAAVVTLITGSSKADPSGTSVTADQPQVPADHGRPAPTRSPNSDSTGVDGATTAAHAVTPTDREPSARELPTTDTADDGASESRRSESRRSEDRRADPVPTPAAPQPPAARVDVAAQQPGDEQPLGVLDLDPDTVGRSPRPPGSAVASTDLAVTPNRGSQIDVVDGDMKAGPGCSIQCITSGVAYPRGVNAEVVLHTDTPATVILIVWNDDGYHHYTNSTPHQVTEFSASLGDLDPGTTYRVLASATDAAGYESQAYGEFTTLRRNVSVSYSYVEVPSPTALTHLDTHIRLDGVWITSQFGDEVDGAVGHLGFHNEQVMDAPRQLDLTFQVARPSQGSACEPAAWYFPRVDGGHGEVAAACRVFATSQQTAIDLDDRPADATSWIQHTLELERSSDLGLAFSIPVVVVVNYLP